MKRFKLFLILLFLLTFISLLIWLEPPLPWLLIHPGLAHRNWEVQQIYSNTKEETKEKFKNDINHKLEIHPYVLIENKYPYHVQADHWILWVKHEKSNKEIENILDKTNKEYKYYENPIQFRSIPEIKHYHVFFKDKLKG
tara:strand:+ start:5397 stop:5816 length:420 start_codon:yes stop_codon:yes gene_type:complete